MRTIRILGYMLVALFVISCKHDHDANRSDDLHEVPHPIDHADTKKKSVAQQVKQLRDDGFEIFDYFDKETGDTVIMQQYFIAFLKRGKNRSQDSLETAKLQEAHLKHLGEMYEKGYADISGPFGDDGDIRGITIYNVPTLEMADSLANMDPSVKAGRLEIEVHPWWAGKGYPLR